VEYRVVLLDYLPLKEIYEYVRKGKSVSMLMLYRPHEDVEKTVGFLSRQGYRIEVYDPDLIPLVNGLGKNTVVRKDPFRIQGDEAMILVYDGGMWIDITILGGVEH
jgi:hypothetical protein